jgi:hypothetical protein
MGHEFYFGSRPQNSQDRQGRKPKIDYMYFSCLHQIKESKSLYIMEVYLVDCTYGNLDVSPVTQKLFHSPVHEVHILFTFRPGKLKWCSADFLNDDFNM